jgi:hypothetical protein
MIEKNSEELLSNLSFEIVKKTAPEELDIFDDIKDVFVENPNNFIKENSKNKEKMLGFGGGVETFVTVVILKLLWSIIEQIGRKGIESFTEEGSKALAKWIQNKMEGKKSETSIGKLKEIRSYVYLNACSSGLDKEKASILADSLIGKIIEGI